MLGRLNHVAIVVPDLRAATAVYRDTLGGSVSAPQALPEHGVTVVFVDTGNSKVELLEPLGEGSPVASWLESRGSLDVFRFRVTVETERDALAREG